MALPTIQSTQFDPIGSMQAGQTMAMNKMAVDDHKQVRSLRQQAVEAPGGYTPEAHQELLTRAGFFEEAQDLADLRDKRITNQQQIMERGLGIMEKTGQLVTKVGAPAWPMFRGSLIAAGIADEESLPVQYDESAAKIAQNFTQNSSDVFRLLRFRDGDQQRDVMNIGGEVTMGKPYDPTKETAMESGAKFLADTMGISLDEAAEKMLTSKDKSDAAVYQDLYKTALRATYGDQAEAARMAKEGLKQVRQVRQETAPTARPPGVQPVQRPGAYKAPEQPQQFEEGKIYQDAKGNKAKYVNGNWEPVQ